MTVKELIEILQAFNPDLRVMLDITHPDMELFKFTSIAVCKEVELNDEPIVAIGAPHSVIILDDES